MQLFHDALYVEERQGALVLLAYQGPREWVVHQLLDQVRRRLRVVHQLLDQCSAYEREGGGGGGGGQNSQGPGQEGARAFRATH